MSDRENEVLLDAVLRPSPPLSPRFLKLILALVALINLAFALSFVLRGAWPIAPFMGLDVALLAWAFRASRIAAKRQEHVTLTRALLSIVTRPPRKDRPDIALNPYWVRVHMAEPADHWTQLELWSHGRGFRVGSFLPPLERAAFAEQLKSALFRARTEIS